MIKKIDRIVLVGTSHVAKQSKEEIQKAIDTYGPEVIALELDFQRFKRLMSNKKETGKPSYMKTIRAVGVTGFLFASLASYVQKKVGQDMGIEPGVDMKSAYILARENSIPTALIDLNINLTLKKLSHLSFFKKMRLFGSLFFKSLKKENRKKLQFNPKSIPSEKVVSNMIGILRKEVPDLYKILIHDRNIHMCKRLLHLREKHEGNLVAVVGAGHVDGMIEYLQKYFEINNSNVSFSFVAHIDDVED